jgi:vancomycin resistance protein VanJ
MVLSLYSTPASCPGPIDTRISGGYNTGTRTERGVVMSDMTARERSSALLQQTIGAARGLLVALAMTYAALVVALTVAWALTGERIWWLALGNVFAVFVFVPLLALVPLAAAIRSRWLRGAVAVPLAIFLATFGPRLLPSLAAPAGEMTLRVATFNQLHTNHREEEIAALIRAQGADVVALQELTRPMAEVAERDLSDIYPYQYTTIGRSPLGMGILSRFPLRSAPDAVGFRRQMVELDVGGRTVTLLNVHLSSPDYRTFTPRLLSRLTLPGGYSPYFRNQEAPLLLREIDVVQGPLVVAGDFNTGDREALYGELDRRLHDAYAETAWGLGFTYPVGQKYFGIKLPFPVVRIDYIWSGGGVTPAEARTVCESAGSDHCMVVADLSLPQP